MKLISFFFLLISYSSCCAQDKTDTLQLKAEKKHDSIPPLHLSWRNIVPGLEFCETNAPRKSDVNDSKISILKLDPKYFDFQLLMATEQYKKPLDAKAWADSFDLDIVINAGMYDLSRKMYSKGFLKGEKHTNQSAIHPNYKTMIAFNPKDTLEKRFTVVDLECDSFELIKKRYHCLAQGLRMLDCNAGPIGWNKRKQYCSQLITTIDDLGSIYLIFVRSPYLHNEMIAYMQQMKLNLHNAIYMEGGPQTSLYVHIEKEGKELFHLEKIGSYVSETYAHDKNDHFWKLPNVIGMKLIR
ncbi:MAG: hypothetical protein K0R65_2310 [Crocinitomicaceae bacterium]|jgi:hypothetical protein|nr:hypothetical protein [Crocinitomicaceae bacterium]